MAKAKTKHKALTVKRIKRLKNQPGRYRDGSGEVKGLHLQVESKTNVSWLLRYQQDGKERWMGLGPLETVSLKQAREKAVAARQQLKNGTDPIAARKADAAARALAAAKNKTFKECAESFVDANRHGWKNAKHEAQWTATLKAYVYPKIGNLSVADVDTGLVLQCIQPIWSTKTETASRVRGRIESVLDFATVSKYRSGDNPARWTGHLEHVLPKKGDVSKVEHHSALPYAELPAFLTKLRMREGVAAAALEFCILTAARTGEIIGAQWDEIDLTAKTWSVPAGRMKGGKGHKVPLSDRAIEIIEIIQALPREQGNPHVFVGPRGGGLSNMAMAAALDRMGYDDYTVHGFRSTFMDWAHETTAFPKTVIDMALAHVVSDKTEEAYRRGDLFKKRVKLMETWERFCTNPPATERDSTVVPLRGNQ
jgi:integrase